MAKILVMLGKDGDGKSSTANSILGKKAFRTGNCSKNSRKCEVQSAKINGSLLQVIDTPGLQNTKNDTPGGKITHKDEVHEIIQNCLNEYPQGVSAFLLVVRYGNDQEQEDLLLLHDLKELFGDKFIKNHCIVVLTHGDKFKKQVGKKQGFEAWCQEQTGVMEELFQECHHRVVLFDNTARQKQESVKKLLSLVQEMSAPFTKDKDDLLLPERQNGNIDITNEGSEEVFKNEACKLFLDSSSEEKKTKDNTEDTHVNNGKGRRGTRAAFVLSLISTLTSAVVLIYVIVEFASERGVGAAKKTFVQTINAYPEVCIACVSLIKNPYRQSDPDALLDGLTKRYEDGVLKCCASNHSQISAVLEALLREKDTAPVYDLDLKTASVSVHKVMKHERNAGTGTVNQIVLTFDPNITNQLTEHIRGVSVTEDGLIIQHTGLYFVYCSVYFRSQHSYIKIMYSYIHRTRPNGPSGVLLKTAHTSCESCKQDNETAFTGGLFLLMAGDFIQVSVSEKDHVDFNKESTYLGLAMIGHKVNSYDEA